MKEIYKCRRSIVALVAIGCLTALGLIKGMDVATSIAAVSAALGAANAYSGRPANGPTPQT